MKIYIMVDLEGISGISTKHYFDGDEKPHLKQKAMQFMANDINACIEGCVQAGATEIIVKDCHGGGHNVSRDMIDERADLIDGDTPKCRFADIENSDGLILLGYHAMAGTAAAVLEHTFSSKDVQNYWLNGKKAGELAIDGSIAAEYNVPVIMVSGDDKTCLEAEDWLPNVVTCEVKKAFSCNGARMKSFSYVHNLITQKTIEAIKNIPNVKPLQLDLPIKLRCELIERRRMPNNPAYKVIDDRTWELESDSVEKALFFYW